MSMCSGLAPVCASLAEHALNIISQLLGLLGLPAAQQHPQRVQHSLKLALVVEHVIKDKASSFYSCSSPILASTFWQGLCIGLLQLCKALICLLGRLLPAIPCDKSLQHCSPCQDLSRHTGKCLCLLNISLQDKAFSLQLCDTYPPEVPSGKVSAQACSSPARR